MWYQTKTPPHCVYENTDGGGIKVMGTDLGLLGLGAGGVKKQDW